MYDGRIHTYPEEESRNASHDSEHKDKSENHGRTRVADLEDVVDLGSGTISNRSLILR
jgi:hypothetical protein